MSRNRNGRHAQPDHPGHRRHGGDCACGGGEELVSAIALVFAKAVELEADKKKK